MNEIEEFKRDIQNLNPSQTIKRLRALQGPKTYELIVQQLIKLSRYLKTDEKVQEDQELYDLVSRMCLYENWNTHLGEAFIGVLADQTSLNFTEPVPLDELGDVLYLLPCLESLTLNDLDVKEVGDLFKHLPTLTLLDLSDNRITEFSPDIACLHRLEYLDMPGNLLSSTSSPR